MKFREKKKERERVRAREKNLERERDRERISLRLCSVRAHVKPSLHFDKKKTLQVSP